MPPKTAPLTLSNVPHNLAERIENLRQKYLQSDDVIYLGDPHAFERLAWFSNGGESYPVLKCAPSEGENSTNSPDEHSPAIPKHVCFALIARISRDGTFVVPDGFFKEPSEYTEKLADVKLTIALERIPKRENISLAQDFDVAYNTISKLRQSKVRKNSKAVIGVLGLGAADSEPKLKLRHRVFNPIIEPTLTEEPSDPTDLPEPSTGSSPPQSSELVLAGYPVRSQRAKDELAEMVASKSHELVPLPAYEQLDILRESHQLIPSLYTSHLEGSLAVVHFFLFHNHISREHKDVFTADVYSILVIDPPKARISNSPRKLLGKRKLDKYPFAEPSGKGKGKQRA
ncbi:hypothetical protein EV361DRAFT_950714 [Lentinula raphanica]|nr:hypothetical protein EV361DRAFT_950714 [Lentinula raphanica]